MQLGTITLPPDTVINSPDLIKTVSVTLDYSITGDAVIFINQRNGGESLVLKIGLSTHQLAKQLTSLVGTQQVLSLDDRTLNVLVVSVEAKPVKEYASYQDSDYYIITVNLYKV